jgi:hypothetical protein
MSPVRVAAAALVLVAACGGDADDPCSGVSGTCVALHVRSSLVTRVDQLELDVLYGARHGTTTTMPGGGGMIELPLATAVELPSLAGDPAHVGIVVAGMQSGSALGTGSASHTVTPGSHVSLDIELVAPPPCTANTNYCGELIGGDPGTVYRCNPGGVPHARGRCLGTCVDLPGDDVCDAFGAPCKMPGFYCGGDKIVGDPGTLYSCQSGSGVAPVLCPNDCLVRKAGSDDICE